jgi:hypothetical protein
MLPRRFCLPRICWGQWTCFVECGSHWFSNTVVPMMCEHCSIVLHNCQEHAVAL